MRRATPGATVTVLITLMCAGPGATASAQPSVRVRAETRIELRAERPDERVRATAILRDDLGTALQDREIHVWLETEGGRTDDLPRHRGRTDAGGAFQVTFRLPSRAYRIGARFDGDDHHQRVNVERELDLARADVHLRVHLDHGGRLSLDQRTHAIVVQASSAKGGAGLRVRLLDELDRRLAEGVTDAQGRVRFDVPRARLGPPGPGRIRAQSVADATRAEAQTEFPIVRVQRTNLTLELSAHQPGEEGSVVRVHGTLSDSGGPLEDRAVGLFQTVGAGERTHLATVLTDREGHYALPLLPAADDAGGRDVVLVARFDSDAPGRLPSESAPLRVGAAPDERPTWPWLLAPIALTTLALFGLSRRVSSSSLRASQAPKTYPAGVQIAPPRTRRANSYDLSGRVLDHVGDEPVHDAMVTLANESGDAVSIPLDAEARFHVERLHAGPYTLRIEAEGYLPAEATIRIPHRGECGELLVRLESLRARAAAPFRRVAEKILLAPQLWGIRTIREVVLEAQTRGHDIQALGTRVEVASYAVDPPSRQDVRAIEASAEKALQDLENGPDGGLPGRSD